MAFGTVMFTATGVTSSYDVDVRFLSSGEASFEQAVMDAADRWAVLVIGDLTDIPIDEPADSCGSDSPALDETLDDLPDLREREQHRRAGQHDRSGGTVLHSHVQRASRRGSDDHR